MVVFDYSRCGTLGSSHSQALDLRQVLFELLHIALHLLEGSLGFILLLAHDEVWSSLVGRYDCVCGFRTARKIMTSVWKVRH